MAIKNKIDIRIFVGFYGVTLSYLPAIVLQYSVSIMARMMKGYCSTNAVCVFNIVRQVGIFDWTMLSASYLSSFRDRTCEIINNVPKHVLGSGVIDEHGELNIRRKNQFILNFFRNWVQEYLPLIKIHELNRKIIFQSV